MKGSALPMSKGKRGPAAPSAGAKSTKKGPVGNDPRGIHPMTKKSGNVKMNRELKGVKKARTGKGANSLDGNTYF